MLIRILFRRTWLALVAFTIVTMLLGIPAFDDPLFLGAAVVWFAGFGALYVRGGLLCAISGLFAYHLLIFFPYSAVTEWYAHAGYFALASVLLVGGYGLYTSTLAGRSLFGDGLLSAESR